MPPAIWRTVAGHDGREMVERDEKGMAYWFRFRSVDGATARALTEELGPFRPRANALAGGERHCVTLALHEAVDPAALANAMGRHGIGPRGADVFASLLAERDTDIIDVPAHVMNALLATRCELRFSFTYISPGDD